MAAAGSVIVCDRLRLYGNSSLCDRLRSAICDPRSSAIVCDHMETSLKRQLGLPCLTQKNRVFLPICLISVDKKRLKQFQVKPKSPFWWIYSSHNNAYYMYECHLGCNINIDDLNSAVNKHMHVWQNR